MLMRAPSSLRWFSFVAAWLASTACGSAAPIAPAAPGDKPADSSDKGEAPGDEGAACGHKEGAAIDSVASLAGTSLEKDGAFLDAAIQCAGGSVLDAKATAAMREGEIANDEATPRALHDAFVSTETTLRVSAPAGDAEVGVFCPSLLLD